LDLAFHLTNTFLFGEEEGDSQEPPAPIVERKTEDIETIVSTIDQHKQRGRVENERSTHSPIVSQKSGPPKQSFQSATPKKKKVSTNNYDDGGDKNPLKGKLEWYHKLQVKRKRQNSQQEVEQHIPKNEIILEDMDLDVAIENIQFPDDEHRLQESKEVATEIATQEEVLSEEESFTVQNALFDKSSRK
jgi:hypothetical protein